MSAVSCAAFGALASTALAAPVIDQEQPIIDSAAGFMLAVGGGSEQQLAQVVTPGLTGVLTEVRLAGVCETPLTVEVQRVTGGVPDGTVLGATTVSLPGPSEPVFRSIPFTSPVPVTAGVPYALVLRTSGSCAVWPGPVGNPYGGGDAYVNSLPDPVGVWVPIAARIGRADLPFQTLVDASSPPPPADTTPPSATCVATAGPRANVKSKPHDGGHENRAGFFRVVASDDGGAVSIVIRDSASDFVSSELTSGDIVKLTQTPGGTPTEKHPGPAGVATHLKLRGDAVLRVTDTAGNTTEVVCEVPPDGR